MRLQCGYLPSGYRCALLPKRMNSNRLRWEMRKKCGFVPPLPGSHHSEITEGNGGGAQTARLLMVLASNYSRATSCCRRAAVSPCTHLQLMTHCCAEITVRFVRTLWPPASWCVRNQRHPPPQVYLCNKGLNLDASWAVYGVCNPRW